MEFEIILIIIGMLIVLIFLYHSTSRIQRSSNSNVDTETSFNRGRVLNSALVDAKSKSLTNEQIEILQDEIGLFSWIPYDLLGEFHLSRLFQNPSNDSWIAHGKD